VFLWYDNLTGKETKMKVKEVMSVRTYYVTMETENGILQYRTDWTGSWEVQYGPSWITVSDTENPQKALTEYWETQRG
jgi:hypothetical protein